jgi:DNA-binding transcriptional LysR family regulator
MDFADVSLVALRVFREVAERGTLTSAAAALGYTQSAVSRQVASLERAAGAPLLERRHDGVRPTTAGHVVLRHAATVLDQIDAATRELAGLPAEAGTVRLGWFTSAGASLLPRALATLRRTHPAITVITREGSTPALVRALRAGSVDLATPTTHRHTTLQIILVCSLCREHQGHQRPPRSAVLAHGLIRLLRSLPRWLVTVAGVSCRGCGRRRR